MKQRNILFGFAAITMAAMVVLVGCKVKSHTFYLEKFEDYISYSNSFFEKVSRNAWRLKDPADYQSVLKEMQQVFGPGDDFYSFAEKDKPKAYQAIIGIFQDKDDPEKYHVVLEVGSKIKEGGGARSWVITDSGFEEGRYALKLILSPEEYLRKMDPWASLRSAMGQ